MESRLFPVFEPKDYETIWLLCIFLKKAMIAGSCDFCISLDEIKEYGMYKLFPDGVENALTILVLQRYLIFTGNSYYSKGFYFGK